MILDVREVSSVTDFFVIASATSEPHVRAIWNEIVDTLKQKHGVSASKPEGINSNNWVVIDYFDVIVHVMIKDVRSQYDLEGLWDDRLSRVVRLTRERQAENIKLGNTVIPFY